jgi:uncharacterized protein (TIGR02996 family)
MNMEKAFLQAILDSPDDDAPRLVLADWLEEQGYPQRAEFIRVQCRLAALDADDPDRMALRERQLELLEAHREEWAFGLKPLAGKARPLFQRGLLHTVRVEPANDEDLPHLIGVLGLCGLHLSGQGLTDGGLPTLLMLPHLEELGLNGTARHRRRDEGGGPAPATSDSRNRWDRGDRRGAPASGRSSPTGRDPSRGSGGHHRGRDRALAGAAPGPVPRTGR